MKKRGRMPNEHTYTIMLEGLANAPPGSGCKPVKEAWSIYESIAASNSKVTRNIIHTNAMLTVCLNHLDMKTLWRVLEELPIEGPDAPNAITYTIILKAIHREVTEGLPTKILGNDDKLAKRKRDAVVDAKRVWADVALRWKKGNLTIDNQLVHAMASVLIESPLQQDCYDVLALYRQTAKVPIYAPKPRSEALSATQRRTASSRNAQDEEDDSEDLVPFVDDYVPSAPEKSAVGTDAETEDEENFDNLFDPIDEHASSGKQRGKHANTQSSVEYIIPTNMDVQLIFRACQQLLQPAAAKSYWKLFAEDGGHLKIVPNHWTVHECLRCLRQTRSSALTRGILENHMVPAGVQTSAAFVIAMSTVLRDRRNRNILNTANALMTLMHSSLMLPEPKAINRYLDLVAALTDSPSALLFLYGLYDSERTTLKKRLNDTYPELKQRLRIVALKHLIPVLSALDEAMAHVGSKPPKIDYHYLQKMPPVDAGACLRAMTRSRALADTAVLHRADAPIPEDEPGFFDLLEEHRSRWKKYSSSVETAKFQGTYAGKSIYPTDRQASAFINAYEAKAAAFPRTDEELRQYRKQQYWKQQQQAAAAELEELLTGLQQAREAELSKAESKPRKVEQQEAELSSLEDESQQHQEHQQVTEAAPPKSEGESQQHEQQVG